MPREALAAIAALPDLERAAGRPRRQGDRRAPGRAGQIAEEKRDAQKQLRRELAQLDFQVFERRTIRALYSPYQLQEMMTWFWFNHFNVFQNKKQVRFLLPDYEERAIRPHVLGRFGERCAPWSTHPAMMVYLDNAENVRGRINENYARELMELHTLGVERRLRAG